MFHGVGNDGMLPPARVGVYRIELGNER
jgi:hypothetical protein